MTLEYLVKQFGLLFGYTRIVNIGGYFVSLDTREGIQRSMYFGEYEQEETTWVNGILKPGMMFVDVGSSFGYYSFIASSLVGNTGMVQSFEPSKPAFDAFVHNVEQNKITNIEAHQMGVGDSDGRIELFNSIGTSVNPMNIHAPTFLPQVLYPVNDRNMGLVDVVRLDDWWEKNHFGNIDLIKIDVEGFEFMVLQGMSRLFEKGMVKHILIEYMQQMPLFSEGTDSDLMHKMLTGYGFEIINKKQYTFHRTDTAFIMGNFLYKMEG